MVSYSILQRYNAGKKTTKIVVMVLLFSLLYSKSGFILRDNESEVYVAQNMCGEDEMCVNNECNIDENPPYHDYLNTSVYIKIEAPFYLFENPHFETFPIAYMQPQVVEILYENYSGWTKIQIDQNIGWINPKINLRFIGRKIGLYANKEDGTPLDYLMPQVVKVLEEECSWIKIQKVDEFMWIDLDFMPPVYLLEDILNDILLRHGYSISIYFENVETGFSYSFNGQRLYFAASVPKAFYAMYLLQKAENGIIYLDSKHFFTNLDYKDGSGVIRKRYPMGTGFTVEELIRLSVSYSDNIASLILGREYGIQGFRNFLYELGGNCKLMGWCIFGFTINAEEAGLYARRIFNYIQGNSKYAEMLLTYMLENQYPFIVSDYPIASKTGWTSFKAWHDMAIVYAPSPYILVILTDWGGWSEANFKDFQEIAMVFQMFNETWFYQHN